MTKRAILRSQTALCTPLMAVFGVGAATAADLPPPDPVRFQEPVVMDLPAVSGVNGKFGIAGGGYSSGRDDVFFLFDDDDDFEEAWYAEGAITVPLGHRFGAQGDAVVGTLLDDIYVHGAGHLFWRDPSLALVGVYGGYTVWDDMDRWRVGVEGEAYLGRLSLETLVGYESGDVEDSVFTVSDLAFYPLDDLRLSVGHRYSDPGHMGTLGVEWQFASGPNVGWAAFADGQIGENDYQAVFAGLRLYFGADKSLIRRHREDDPRIKVPNAYSLTACTDSASSGATIVDSEVEAIAVDGFIGPEEIDVPCGEDATLDDEIFNPPSDIRLKRDIGQVAALDNGINLYSYRYNWSDEVYVGVMAQEIAAIVPDAVVVAADGYFRVNYSKLGLSMQTWDAWVRAHPDHAGTDGLQALAA